MMLAKDTIVPVLKSEQQGLAGQESLTSTDLQAEQLTAQKPVYSKGSAGQYNLRG
jgi:hypothetical protein